VPGALPAYLSNGVIGLRVGQLPLSSSVAMISGFAGVDPQTGVESFAPAPYPVAGDVVVGVYAARLGDRTRARDLLQRGYADFVTEPFTVTLEYEPTHFPEMTPAGPFTANLGGFLMALLYGLPDLQPDADDPAGWPKRRVVLPTGWDALEVERVWVRGQPMTLQAQHGESTSRLRNLD
jgi:protein-glucosylgalactosylhydroxylysine glucosidase